MTDHEGHLKNQPTDRPWKQPNMTEAPPRPRTSLPLIIGGILLVLAVAVATWFAFRSSGEDEAATEPTLERIDFAKGSLAQPTSAGGWSSQTFWTQFEDEIVGHDTSPENQSATLRMISDPTPRDLTPTNGAWRCEEVTMMDQTDSLCVAQAPNMEFWIHGTDIGADELAAWSDTFVATFRDSNM